MTERDQGNDANIGNFNRREHDALERERRQAMSELGESGVMGVDMDKWSKVERATRGKDAKEKQDGPKELGPGGKAILGFALNRDEESDENDASLAIDDDSVRRTWKSGRQEDDPAMFPKELRNELRKGKGSSSTEDNETAAPPRRMSYEDRLQGIGLTMKEAQQLVDDLLTSGFVEKTYPLTHNRSVTFRSRDADDMRRALDEIEDYNPKFAPTSSHILSMNTLAASLVNLAGKDYTSYSMEAKKEMLRKLPEVALRLLTSKLNQFDNMLLTVMDEDAIVNF